MMESIVQERVKVISPIKFISIQSLYLNQRKDEHVTVEIEGIIDYTSSSDAVYGKKGQVYIYDVQEQEKPLFTGLIQKIKMKCTGGLYTLQLFCSGYTVLLEQNETSCSYQSKKTAYLDIMQEVMNRSHRGEVYPRVDDCKIHAPVVRYRETDWDFLKRLGAYLETSIMPAATSDRPEIYVGFPQKRVRKEAQIEKIVYIISPQNTIQCRVTSKESWDIGEQILLNNHTFFVVEKKGIFEKGSLSYSYLLAGREYMKRFPYQNEKLKGVSIRGKVIDIRQEMIKVHLDIDVSQEKEEAWWFPYLPETGNLMYCMPELGDRVNMYFGCGEEKNAIVTNCFRYGDGADEGGYLISPYEKRIVFNENKIGFISSCNKNQRAILLQDEKMVLQDNYQIRIQAQNRISMEASKIQVVAPKEVTILKGDILTPSVINLNHVVDIVGQGSGIECTEEIGRKHTSMEEKVEESYDLGELKNRIRTSIPFDGKGNSVAESLFRTMTRL